MQAEEEKKKKDAEAKKQAKKQEKEDKKKVQAFFFFTLVTGPRRSVSLKLRDTRVYEPQIRARLGITAHFCES